MSQIIAENIQGAATEKRVDQARTSLYLVVIGMWILFGHIALQSLGHNYMPVAYCGYFILFVALFFELKNGRLQELPSRYMLWVLAIWLFAGVALCYGVLQLHELQFISRDVWPFSYFACLMVATHDDWWAAIDKMIYRQFIIAILLFIPIWYFFEGDYSRASIFRAAVTEYDQPRISFAWGLLFGWQYMFLSLNRSTSFHRMAVTFIGVSMYLIFALIFLKRQPLLEFGILLILKFLFLKPTVYLKNNTRKIILTLSLAIMMFVGGIILISRIQASFQLSFFEGLSERFLSEGSLLDTAMEDDRLSNTPGLIIEKSGTLGIIWGQGLGSTVERADEPNNAVESGLFTLFMKGGIIYLIIWYSGLVSIILSNFSGFRRISVYTALSTMIIVLSPVSSFFIMYPASGYMMFWLGRSAVEGKLREPVSVSDSLLHMCGVSNGKQSNAGQPV